MGRWTGKQTGRLTDKQGDRHDFPDFEVHALHRLFGSMWFKLKFKFQRQAANAICC
jgi:hypothetical protein